MNKKLQNILKNTARSMYLSIKVMPRRFKDIFTVGYLLCRAADTIADTKLINRTKKLFFIEKFPNIVEFPKENADILDEIKNSVSSSKDLKYEKILIDNLSAVLQEFSKFDKPEKEIVIDVVKQVCKGMETDLNYFDLSKEIKAFETSKDLETYCNYIGGEPGVFWTKVLLLNAKIGIKNSALISYGSDIGSALQITNILRDIVEDLKNNRCYIPLDDLEKVNLTPSDLLNIGSIDTFRPVIKKWILWAADKLKCSEEYVNAVPRSLFTFKAATIWPIYWCLDTLCELAGAVNILNGSERVKISKKKIYLTILKTPPAVLSRHYFSQGFRFRREILLTLLTE